MNWTNEIKTDLLIESRMTAKVWWSSWGRETDQKGKRTHGHGEQCGDFGGQGV